MPHRCCDCVVLLLPLLLLPLSSPSSSFSSSSSLPLLLLLLLLLPLLLVSVLPPYAQVMVPPTSGGVRLDVQLASQQQEKAYGFFVKPKPFTNIDLYTDSPFEAILGSQADRPAEVPPPPMLVRMPGGKLCMAQQLKSQGTLHPIASGCSPQGRTQLWCSVTQTQVNILTLFLPMAHVCGHPMAMRRSPRALGVRGGGGGGLSGWPGKGRNLRQNWGGEDQGQRRGHSAAQTTLATAGARATPAETVKVRAMPTRSDGVIGPHARGSVGSKFHVFPLNCGEGGGGGARGSRGGGGGHPCRKKTSPF